MNENDEYLIDLFVAIRSIEDEYCNWQYRDSIQAIERVFAYELYHKLKFISILKPETYQNIRFDGEIAKGINNKEVNKLGTNYSFCQENFSPDLVLHKNQIDSSFENQKLVIEIKTKNSSDEKIAKDILKLYYAIEKLNFQYGVFICVNTNFETIKKKLKRIFNRNVMDENTLNNLKRIMIANYENQILQYNSLINILE